VTVIRSAALRGFRATVLELGGDPDRFAQVAGLPPGALDADDMLVPLRSEAIILRYAATELGCPDIGLRIAARQDLSMLGPLALAIQSCSMVQEALDCTTRYLFMHSPMIALSVEDDPYAARGVVALTYRTPSSGEHEFGIDLALGFIHRAVTDLMGGPYGLRSVELPYQPSAPLGVYEEFFRAPVNVRSGHAALRIPASLLGQPLKGSGNLHLRQLAEAYLAAHVPATSTRSVAPRVRAAVQESLGTTTPSVTSTARILAMHPRTLQRRLAEENTTFLDLVDDVRRNAARQYLTMTDLSMTQVAGLLGLSEQSALTRCTRRWWGATPRQVRRNPDLVRDGVAQG
jgi:AraC-like DNA-binding protein